MSRKKSAGLANNPEVARELSDKRWKMAEQTDSEIREHFQSVQLGQGFEELYRMRQQMEIAAGILEGRNSVETKGEFCANCKKEFNQSVRPYTVETRKDPKTQIVSNTFFCSLGCQVAVKREVNRPEAVIAQNA